MNVQDYLTKHGKAFKLLLHPVTFTARRMAAAVCVPECEVAKTVVLRLDHGFRFAVAVLPADQQIDEARVGQLLGGAIVEIADEKQLVAHCPDCDPGAVPPFGNMYGMLTLLDESLTHRDEITFESNRHCESIRMSCRDFLDLEHPLIGQFAVVGHEAGRARS